MLKMIKVELWFYITANMTQSLYREMLATELSLRPGGKIKKTDKR